MTTVRQNKIFGQRGLPHTVIIARGDKVRHMTLRPWVLALSATAACAVMAGSVGVAAYFAMQDTIVASGTVRHERLQADYEQRIASLRAQLDRAVSRQLLDRETVETKVDVLLDQQLELTERYEKLRPLLDRAQSSGLIPDAVPDAVPVPQPAPSERRAALAPAAAPRPALGPGQPSDAGTPLALSFGPPAASPLERFGAIEVAPSGQSLADTADWRLSAGAPLSDQEGSARVSPVLIQEIGRSIEAVEEGQLAGLFGLALSARSKAAGITSALRSEGIRVPVVEDRAVDGENDGGQSDGGRSAVGNDAAVSGEGGPYIPFEAATAFDLRYAELDTALVELQTLRRAAQRLPLATPVTNAAVSSTFGVRADPFLGRSALHTGMDFAAASGARVAAAAAGTVVEADLNGGYGNMVEIDHGGGVTTRYAHLSSIAVAVGDAVLAGATIGRVGSTGRSTGPHLHYEVRRDGQAIDPSRFLRAGRKIDALG